MSNNLNLADSINFAWKTGQTPTFIYNGTTYSFSPDGLLTFIAAEQSGPVLASITATAAEINVLDNLGVDVTIDIAASATTDGMDITITVVNAAGATVAGVHQLEFWMSEDADGIGLTADAYSGDLTASVGAILSAHTAKKHWSVVTADTGIFTATLVDSANPADQYVACKNPTGAAVSVSAVSGTNWEGAV